MKCFVSISFRTRHFLIAGFCVFALNSTPAADTPLVSRNETWRYHKGTNAPQASWQTIADASLDSTWASGAGGFGYADNFAETNNCGTILTDMRNGYSTLYIRKSFEISNSIDANDRIRLTMDWDDGFVAYLDGVEVKRAVAPGAAGVESAFTALATGNHECSTGNSTPQPVETYDLGPVGSRLAPGTHVLAIMGLNAGSNSSDFILVADLAHGPQICPANTICADTNWTLANSPYFVSNTITIPAGVTLTIEPGVVVQFTNGAGLTVQGRLLAEGNPANRIRFTKHPNATSWTRLDFTGSALESRIAFADIEYAGSSGTVRSTGTPLHLENIVWTNITVQILNLNNCGVRLLDSVLPSIGAAELYHHSGLPANGVALVKGNTFGSPASGVNDVIDFTGGQRPGAILQLYDNVFLGGPDDALDLDGTDAHIEGNIFMNFHAGGGPGAADTASAISGGKSGSTTSKITIARNLIYDCDRGILCKEGNFYVVQNNTFVKMTVAAVNLNEPLRSGVTPGAGVIFEGNIVWNTPANFENVTTNSIAMNQNISSASDFTNRGVGNLVLDPLLVGTNGITAATIRDLFSLQTNSPAIGAGPNGLDCGAIVPAGASISGEPSNITTNHSAVLNIAGPGIAAYYWRTNDGPWSDLVNLTNSFSYTTNLFANAAPITLSNLADGTYTVYVLGADSAGLIQNSNAPAISKTWIVQLDSDGDGMPDSWEEANGTNPLLNDASVDADFDGLTNLQEYWAGTHPNDATSVLRLSIELFAPASLLLSFEAISNRAYTLESRTWLDSGDWGSWLLVPAVGTNRAIEITNGVAGMNQQFYRVIAHPQ